MGTRYIFDAKHYEELNSSRGTVVSALLSQLKTSLGLRTAVDIGCGLGYFAELLQTLGFEVTGVDGRSSNVEEAKRRNPKVKFLQCDAEDPRLRALGQFDLVFCFGLLYHLENPLLTVRHLYQMTSKVLLVESVIFPGDEPTMALVDEEVHEDQGLNHVAFYPTEACLIKMLYRSGYSCVYGFLQQPDHPDYHTSAGSRRVRTMLVASRNTLVSDILVAKPEVSTAIRPWNSFSGVPKPNALQKLRKFVDKPLLEKVRTVRRLVKGQSDRRKSE